MGIYTNLGLVKHAEKALALNTKYMWGGLLREITPAYIDQLQRIYGNQSGTGYSAPRWTELKALVGKKYYGVDCVGLIKSYYWSGKADGGTGSPKYGTAGFPDVNANYMYQQAKVKGRISSIPETPGLIVYCKTHPHVGIYIGNGYTIESTLGSRGDGVVKRKLDNLWEYWFECPYIEYKEPVQDENITCTLAYNATIRDTPKKDGKKIGILTAGSKCAILKGSDTVDSKTGYTYVLLSGGKEQWIVKSAIKGQSS